MSDKWELMEKCARIKKEISKLEREIRGQEYLIREYEHSQGKIEDAITEWENREKTYYDIVLAPVVVPDYFEGEAAGRVAVSMGTTIGIIDLAKDSVEALLPGIADQIAIIKKYIDELQGEINALKQELEALVMML